MCIRDSHKHQRQNRDQNDRLYGFGLLIHGVSPFERIEMCIRDSAGHGVAERAAGVVQRADRDPISSIQKRHGPALTALLGRAGQSLEHHLSAIFDGNEILYTAQAVTAVSYTHLSCEAPLRRVHIHKGRDAAELHRMLVAWGAIAAKLKAGEITKEEYDRWRYRYPEQMCIRDRQRAVRPLALHVPRRGHHTNLGKSTRAGI